MNQFETQWRNAPHAHVVAEVCRLQDLHLARTKSTHKALVSADNQRDKLVTALEHADIVIEALMQGVAHIVIDIGMLNDTLMEITSVLREVKGAEFSIK